MYHTNTVSSYKDMYSFLDITAIFLLIFLSKAETKSTVHLFRLQVHYLDA